MTDSGGVEAVGRRSSEDPSTIEVRLTGGELLFIPAALVGTLSDGTYRFAHPFSAALDVAGAEMRIPLVAEELEVQKREAPREAVRLSKKVSQREEVVDVPLLTRDVTVERIPVGRMVEAPAPPREEDGTLVIPIYEEAVVVEKRLVLREEVRITAVRQQKHETQRVTLRREDVEIERTGAPQASETGAAGLPHP